MKAPTRQVIAFVALWAVTASPASAWGTSGHRMINTVAVSSLPLTVPPFLRTKSVIAVITDLGPEEDRLKGSGSAWDHDNDPGHYLDVGDDNTVGGVVKLDALPQTFDAYDAALRKVGQSPFSEGYVPYEILEGWQQIRRDFAYWRADDYMARHATSQVARDWFVHDRYVREGLTVRDIGVWGHFVGDASQPLHITVHYNGWGSYPNPNKYSTATDVHAKFEGAFVRDHAKTADVVKLLTPYQPQNPAELISQDAMLKIIGTYLAQTNGQVVPLYEIEKSGGFDSGSPQAVAFVDQQLAHGAAAMRDLVGLAWEDSLNDTVAYPEISVRDILSGKVAPTPQAFGSD
jgi:hypothetical protein